MKQDLDQFYTNPKVSDFLVKYIFDIFPNIINKNFIEPSAGCGNFVTSLMKYGVKKEKIQAWDIDPKDENIKKADYLKLKIKYDENNFVIGNPPFGKKGKLAIEFINKSLTEADYVAMIVPNIFNRYLTQKNINPNAKLVISIPLEKDAFLVENKAYNVNCLFQIWVNPKILVLTNDKRIKTPLKNKDEKFVMYIYNNTKQSLKYFDKKKYKWDYAIVRQGYYDYNKKVKNPKNLLKNRQYVFLKFNDEKAKKIMEYIDWNKLAFKNSTTVPGFSNTDIIQAYITQERKIKMMIDKSESPEIFDGWIKMWGIDIS